MAIVRTVLDGSYTALKNYLEANATDFYDTFSISSESVYCAIDGVNALQIKPPAGSTSLGVLGFFNPNPGNVWTDFGKYFTSAYKTSKGILLINDYQTFLFISKSAAGKTVELAGCLHSNSSAYKGLCIHEFGETGKWLTQISSGTLASYIKDDAIILSLAPVPLGNGDYLSDVLLAAYSPYTSYGFSGGTIVQVNGIQYAFAGLFALRE